MRTLISDTPQHLGETVTIKGWVTSVRAHGQLAFADVRDRTGTIQIVGNKNLAQTRGEFVVEITGLIKPRAEKYFNPKIITGQIEMEMSELKVISEAHDLPFDIHQPELNVGLPVLLDHRAASLRNQKVQDVFKLQSTTLKAFRDYLTQNGFTEIAVPTIVAGATEGGSEVFKVDYFDHEAYLAQSPQLYKQILTSIFERVFTVSHAYRAEPSITTRHLTEYVSLDVEMGFIDSWQDVVKMADGTVKAIFKAIETKHPDILEEYGVTIPKVVKETPQIKLKDALELIYKRTGRDVRQELDLDPEGERELCRWSLEEFGSELVFVTHFYTKKRAWYSFADPNSPEETLTMDLIGRGVEWISGGQRIHDYQTLVDKIKSKGMNPDNFETYLEAFRFGMPPEGGFAIGLERICQNILGLSNIREASLFPRDMERVDRRLPKVEKYKTKK